MGMSSDLFSHMDLRTNCNTCTLITSCLYKRSQVKFYAFTETSNKSPSFLPENYMYMLDRLGKMSMHNEMMNEVLRHNFGKSLYIIIIQA